MNNASLSSQGDSFAKCRSRFRFDAGQLLKGSAHSLKTSQLACGNQLLTKLVYLESWAFGARVLALRPAFSVGADR